LDEAGQAVVQCTFDDLQLLPGGYRIKAHTLDPEGLRVHDTAELSITVSGKTRELGITRLAHRWSQPTTTAPEPQS
jgi:lipopolysaccharide transport system ATP-binding protein